MILHNIRYDKVVLQNPSCAKKLWLATFCIAICIVLDQLTKMWIKKMLGIKGYKIIAPFLTLVYTWNPGISFGIFPCHSLMGRLFLLAGIGFFISVLSVWYWRTHSFLQRIALLMIIGASLSNVYDRILYGAVFDFIWFHWHRWYFPVFNLADMLITIGFLVFLNDSFRWKSSKKNLLSLSLLFAQGVMI